MKTLIRNGKIILEDEIIESDLLIDDDKILGFQNSDDAKVIDAQGLYVSPGFIDVHTHGRKGADTMDATKESLEIMSREHLKTGVTSFLPTTMTMPIEDVARAMDAIGQYKDEVTGAKIIGVHLEGPFISAKYKGAQPESAIIAPSIENYKALCHGHEELVKKITIAPEREGALELIDYLAKHEVSVSVGHSNATFEETVKAIHYGANSTTHTYNAMTPLHHREPGIVGTAMLNQRLYAELILDGKHVKWPSARILAEMKDDDKLVLVTDSLEAAGMPVGEYMLGGQKVFVKDGRAELENGTIAGSIAGMNEEVKHAVEHLNVSLVKAVNYASRNPADSLNRKDLGRIAPGAKADLIFFNANIDIMHAMVDGILKF